MNTTASIPGAAAPCPFQLRFESLFNPGRGLAFPCDAGGQVPIDSLSETALRNYFDATDLVGIEYATPAVVRP